jgi:hypothetical protein
MRKRFLRYTLFTLAAIGGVYGFLSYRYWTNPPQLTRNFTAEFNARIANTPENERAWPAYRQVLLGLTEDRPKGYQEVWRIDPSALADDPAFADFVRKNSDGLTALRAASLRPVYGFPITDGVSADDARLEIRRSKISFPDLVHDADPVNRTRQATENPSLESVRFIPFEDLNELVNLAAADAHLAAREGNLRRMTDDVLSIMRIAEHTREYPHTINDMVATMIFDSGLRTWGRLMETATEVFDESSLIELDRQARGFAGGSIRVRFDYDRNRMADALQRDYTDDGDGDGYRTHLSLFRGNSKLDWTDRLLAPLMTGMLPSRREMRDEHERMLTLVEQDCSRPLWKCDTWPSEVELKRLLGDQNYQLVSAMTASYEPHHRQAEKAVQHRDAMLALSAMLRFRLKRGDWPRTLDELVPEYLAEVPIDRLTGGKLGYKLQGDRPVLYSFGADGDDDGGRAARLPKDNNANPRPERPWHWHLHEAERRPEGDLILWPVVCAEELEFLAKQPHLNLRP